MPCAWEPRRRCGETSILALPTRFMFPLTGNGQGGEEAFFSPVDIHIRFAAFKSILLHDGDPNETEMKIKDKVKVLHLSIVHFLSF